MKCKQCGEDIPIDMVQIGGVHMNCEWEYFHNKTEKMIKLRPCNSGPWLIQSIEEFKNAAESIFDSEDEDSYEVRFVRMSKGQIENLPEFEGW